MTQLEKPARKAEAKSESKSVRSQPATDAVPAVVSPFDAAVDQVDEVLATAALGLQLTDSDIGILERSGLIRKLDQERQVDRMRNILRHQAAAGTKEERATLQAAIDEAAKTESELAPELERQISELTRQRELLATASGEAKRRLKVMQDAVESLRLLRRLPDRVAEEYRRANQMNRKMGTEIERLREDVARCDEILRAADAGLPDVLDRRNGIRRNITPELVETVSKQRQHALEDIAAQTRLHEASKQETDRLLDRYVR